MPTPGWVYVLTNAAMPDLVKIGMTGRNPATRAAELTAATGVPAPFVIAWSRAVSDCAAVEASVHRLLDNRRVSGNREFFRCDVATARQVIEAAAGALLRPWWVSAWRGLWVPSPPPRRAYGTKSYGPGWQRRRGSSDGLLVLGLVVVLALPVVLLKPALPSWLPASVVRVAVLLERMHR